MLDAGHLQKRVLFVDILCLGKFLFLGKSYFLAFAFGTNVDVWANVCVWVMFLRLGKCWCWAFILHYLSEFRFVWSFFEFCKSH